MKRCVLTCETRQGKLIGLRHLSIEIIFLSLAGRGIVMNENADPLCANLINLSGQRWRILRTKLSPAFTAGKIRHMFAIIEESSKKYKVLIHLPLKTFIALNNSQKS